MDEIEDALSAAARGRQLDADGFAMLGNLLTRQGRYLDAVEAYRTATELDPGFAAAHWACAELSHILRDEASSSEHRRHALRLQRLYPDPAPQSGRYPILLLLRDAPYSSNTPLELIVDRSRLAVHKYYIEGRVAAESLPEHSTIVCAFGFAVSAARAIEAARDVMLHSPAASINHPHRLQFTARDALAQTLSGIKGIMVPASRCLAASDVPRIELPQLIRPVDTHSGDGLALVDSQQALRDHTGRFESDAYYSTEFVDYRSSDGYYRKYRIMFVDGVAYPYHLAIAPRWMVHYQSSPMDEHQWMREEERTFLSTPYVVFPSWYHVTRQISNAIGLDYFGIDVARLPDGSMLVFEADAAMLVHDESERDVFAYKRPFVAKIREALERLLRVTPPHTP
jgi:hypothetical protein